jgi:hypothetical protein
VALKAKDRHRIKAWLANKYATTNCLICTGMKSISAKSEIVTLPAGATGTGDIRAVALVCGDCGNIRLLLAAPIGV